MYCCVTRLLQFGVEIVLKKVGHVQSGGQIVKSQEISVFITLSYWISSSNWNHLSRPNCTQTLILCKFYLKIHHTRYLNARFPMHCAYPLDNDSTLEINLTKHFYFNIVFINLNGPN